MPTKENNGRLKPLLGELDDLRLEIDAKIATGDEAGLAKLLSRLRSLLEEIDNLRKD